MELFCFWMVLEMPSWSLKLHAWGGHGATKGPTHGAKQLANNGPTKTPAQGPAKGPHKEANLGVAKGTYQRGQPMDQARN